MKVDIIGITIDLGADRRGVDMDPRHAPGMDIVEVNPILDVQNQTAALGVEFVLSTLGQRIWNGD